MAVSHGMDVGEVRRLGGSLQKSATSIDDLIGRIESAVSGSTWVGSDAARFKEQWWPEHRGHLTKMRDDLHGLGQSAINNASDQEQASGAVGGEGISGVAPVIPQERISILKAEAALLENPRAANQWWNNLSEDEQDSLIASDPMLIGNLDGIPPVDRYEANRINIRTYVEGLQTERAELVARIDSPLEIAADSLMRDGNLADELAALDAKIAKFEALGSRSNQILLFDPTAGDGLVAQVFGDLSTASHIATVVPGVGNDLDGFSSIDAQRLYKASGGNGGDTATIQWLGYDTPSGFESKVLTDPSAVSADRAEEWAGDLASFVDGLQANSGAEITVVAHSYGTVLAAEAAKVGMDVEKVVLLGSPGVPADNASVFNGANVYAMANNLDPIAKTGVLGTNPVDAEFGATVLDGSWGGHSAYFDPGTSPLNSIATAVEAPVELDNGMLQSIRIEDGIAIRTAVAKY